MRSCLHSGSLPDMTTANVRLAALVRARILHPKTLHSVGLPAALNEGVMPHAMPPPDVLVINQEGPGNVFLHRFTRSGEFAGDTWHASVDEALRQADHEYGPALTSWTGVPEDVTDIREFCRIPLLNRGAPDHSSRRSHTVKVNAALSERLRNRMLAGR